jgi:hypothetical protein
LDQCHFRLLLTWLKSNHVLEGVLLSVILDNLTWILYFGQSACNKITWLLSRSSHHAAVFHLVSELNLLRSQVLSSSLPISHIGVLNVRVLNSDYWFYHLRWLSHIYLRSISKRIKLWGRHGDLLLLVLQILIMNIVNLWLNIRLISFLFAQSHN